jgi:hypothetical protein
MNNQIVECVDGQWKPVEPRGVPDGVLGQVMPGEMAACNEHNNQELWKQQKDPSYVPKFKHPEILPVEGQEKEPKEEPAEGPVPDTGCIVLPAFPPWGCQQEAKVDSGELALPAEAPAEEPKEEPAEGLVPDTMPGIWKSLGFKAESLYDFGTRTLSPARKTPSLEASFKAYRKNMLLTVARALLVGAYGRKYSAEQVRKSVIASWKGNSRMKGFSDVLKANKGPVLEKRITEILDDIPKFIDGKVETTAKYMKGFKGEPWCIKSFVRYVSVSKLLDLKKTGWRSSKKK